jgi:hypothetical protein
MSLSDFFMHPSGGSRSLVVEDLEQTPEGRLSGRTQRRPVSLGREISCPSVGTSVFVYREVCMSACITADPLPIYCKATMDRMGRRT